MRYSFSYAMKFARIFLMSKTLKTVFMFSFESLQLITWFQKGTKMFSKELFSISQKNVAPKIDYFFLICLLVKLQVLNALPKIVNFASLALSKNSILVDILLAHFGTVSFTTKLFTRKKINLINIWKKGKDGSFYSIWAILLLHPLLSTF